MVHITWTKGLDIGFYFRAIQPKKEGGIMVFIKPD